MKILYTTESCFSSLSGVLQAVIELANSMKKRGHKILLILPSEDFNEHLDYYNGIKILKLRSIRNPFKPNHHISLYRYSIIKEFIEKEKPDLVHINDPAIIGFISRNIAIKKNIPIIISHHFPENFVKSYIPKFLKNRFGEKIIISTLHKYLRWFYSSGKIIICPSNFIKNMITKCCPSEKIIVISNGVHTERFRPGKISKLIMKKYNLSTQTKKLLYVGRIDKDKNIDIMLKAMKLVLKERKYNKRIELLIVGKGVLLKKFINYCKKNSIEDKIRFLGFIPDKDLADIYRLANIFIITSKTEAQSIVTLQALSTGLPVIAANASALPELVKDNFNGYLVNPNNVNEVRDAIIKMLDNKNIKLMSFRSRQIALKHNIRRVMEKFERIYKGVAYSR